MRFRMTTLALIAGLMVAAPALADDFFPTEPDWSRSEPNTVTAEWDFNSDTVPLAPDGTLAITDLSNADGGVETLLLEVFNGVWDELGIWSFPNGGHMDFQVNNVVDFLPLKFTNIQITHTPLTDIEGLPLRPQAELLRAFDNVVGEEVTPFGPELITQFFNGDPIPNGQTVWFVDMQPNPDWEVYRITVPAGMSIDQVVIDTISAPEPASLALMGMAGLAMFKRRS